MKRILLSFMFMQKFDKKTIFLTILLLCLLFFFNIINIRGTFMFLSLFTSAIVFPLVLCRNPDKYIDKLKLYITNFTIFLISIFFCLIFIESYLHIAQPHFLETDFSALGDFRDFTSRGRYNEKLFNKEKGIFRILGLGDSFAESLSDQNKNYHDFLQTMFDTIYGRRKVEIINAGKGWVGPGYYLHILEKYGDLLKPDLVLVGFFMGNDFMGMNFDYITRGPYIFEPRDIKKRIFNYFKFKNFWLCQFLTRKMVLYFDNKKRIEELKNHIVEEEGVFSKGLFLKAEKERMWICEKQKRYDLENLWNEQGVRVLSNIKNWCKRRNIELIIAIFPDQFQVEKDLRQEVLKRYNLEEDSIDLYYPIKILLDFCKQNNIYCIDLTEEFQKNAEFKKLYFIRDTHWNEEGNELAAEIILNYIEKNKLVKANKI